MFRTGVRAVLPLASLVLGTWIGMGRPDRSAAAAAGQRVLVAVAGRRDARADVFRVPPVDSALPAIEPGAPPPPPPKPTDWPHLNPEAKISKAWLLAEGP